MKKPFILAAFISFQLIAFSVSAQKMLTNREVYNFDPGDVFDYKSVSLPNPNDYFYTRYTVLSKSYSSASDTVKYRARRREYHATGPNNIYDKTDTTTLAYTDLDSLAIKPATGHPGKDSISITSKLDSDERVVNERYYITLTHFEETRMDDVYKEGVGQTVQSTYSDGDGGGYVILTYYKKGNQQWGQPILSGISEGKTPVPEIEIYPNPIHNGHALYIKNLPKELSCMELFDMEGRQIQNITPKPISTTESEIDDIQLPEGIYFFRVQNENEVATYKLVVTD